MKLVTDSVVKDKIHLVNTVGLLQFGNGYIQNLTACLLHPTHCIKWVWCGEEYYQLHNSTHRKHTYIYVAELAKNVLIENSSINQPGLERYYIPHCSFLYRCSEHPQLTNLIESTKHHPGVFELTINKNTTPLNIMSRMVNMEINKPIYLNIIEQNHIWQLKH